MLLGLFLHLQFYSIDHCVCFYPSAMQFSYCSELFQISWDFVLPHKAGIVLSRSVNYSFGILVGIVVNLQFAFGKIAIFTLLILLIYELERSFHLLIYSSISFFKGLSFFIIQVFHLLLQSSSNVFYIMSIVESCSASKGL